MEFYRRNRRRVALIIASLSVLTQGSTLQDALRAPITKHEVEPEHNADGSIKYNANGSIATASTNVVSGLYCWYQGSDDHGIVDGGQPAKDGKGCYGFDDVKAYWYEGNGWTTWPPKFKKMCPSSGSSSLTPGYSVCCPLLPQRPDENAPKVQGHQFVILPDAVISEYTDKDASILEGHRVRGEYHLVVAQDAVINEYAHDDSSILEKYWRPKNALPLPGGKTKGQTIGAWLFRSSPNTLSVIARERPSRGGSDFLVGYKIALDRMQEEGDVGKTAKAGGAEETLSRMMLDRGGQSP